jgi:hypothetical protein
MAGNESICMSKSLSIDCAAFGFPGGATVRTGVKRERRNAFPARNRHDWQPHCRELGVGVAQHTGFLAGSQQTACSLSEQQPGSAGLGMSACWPVLLEGFIVMGFSLSPSGLM